MDHCDTLNGPDGTMGIHNHTTRLDSIRFDSIRFVDVGSYWSGACKTVPLMMSTRLQSHIFTCTTLSLSYYNRLHGFLMGVSIQRLIRFSKDFQTNITTDPHFDTNSFLMLIQLKQRFSNFFDCGPTQQLFKSNFSYIDNKCWLHWNVFSYPVYYLNQFEPIHFQWQEPSSNSSEPISGNTLEISKLMNATNRQYILLASRLNTLNSIFHFPSKFNSIWFDFPMFKLYFLSII